MNTNTTLSAVTETAVVIANVLPSGAAFAIRLDNGDNCYVPVTVASVAGVAIGSELTARIVPNRYPDKVDRTPWLVVHLTRAAAPVQGARPVQYAMPFQQFDEDLTNPPAPPQPTTADRVRALMQQGGVWTQGDLFEHLFPGRTRGDGLSDYNAISAAVRTMYAKGECAKFQMWRSSSQSKPSREWFTCFPDRADVDEWEE